LKKSWVRRGRVTKGVGRSEAQEGGRKRGGVVSPKKKRGCPTITCDRAEWQGREGYGGGDLGVGGNKIEKVSRAGGKKGVPN